MAELHRGVPEVIIPRVIDEATTRRVLTMEYVAGIAPDEACSPRPTRRSCKDRWGEVLLAFLLRGLLQHRLLHADPNLANFAFREDGAVVSTTSAASSRSPQRSQPATPNSCWRSSTTDSTSFPRFCGAWESTRGRVRPCRPR